MAQIGSCWNQDSWESTGGWVTGSWATAVEAAAVTTTGKYQREHDAALVDLAAAQGFSTEHRGALLDLGDAGV